MRRPYQQKSLAFPLLLLASLGLLLPASLASAQPNITYETKYFQATLDHFNFGSNETFKLRYLENSRFWEPKRKGPIFFYTGNEGDITMFANNTGFMWELAPKFRALLIFAEHRYYGESLPFGNLSFTVEAQPPLYDVKSKEYSNRETKARCWLKVAEAMYEDWGETDVKMKEDPKYSGYLSSSQALADYIELISHLKENYGVPHAAVIAFGGSYGGMLSAWIRMKYPAVIQGALASSAPIWQFTDLTPCYAFNRVVSSAYSLTSESCPIAIRNSWPLLNKMGSTDSGRAWLSKNWKLCSPLKSSDQVKTLKDWLEEIYVNLAMTNYPYPTNFLAPLPAYPIKAMCKHLTDPRAKDETLLGDVFRAVSVYFNGTGSVSCLDLGQSASAALGTLGWDYQSCTEMVMPMCDDGQSTMFEASKWDLAQLTADCQRKFKVTPQPQLVLQEYGGKNIDWASNIIFSNGLLDPWSSGGVLENVSRTAIAVVIPESAHHLDLRASNPADPYSVTAARRFYKDTIRKWISGHQSQLKKSLE